MKSQSSDDIIVVAVSVEAQILMHGKGMDILAKKALRIQSQMPLEEK